MIDIRQVDPHRRALIVSCAVIVLYWIAFAASRLLRDGPPAMPTDIAALFLRKLAEAIVAGVVVFVLLRTTGEKPEDLGITRDGLPGSIGRGLLWGAALFVVINVLLNSVLSSVLGGSVDARTREMFRDPSAAPWWVLTAIVGGGFAEELVRVFVLSRFRRLAGTLGLAFAIIVDSIVFGIGHLYQGTVGAVSAGICGALLAFVWLRRGRATDAMATHAAFDLYGVAAAYALYRNR